LSSSEVSTSPSAVSTDMTLTLTAPGHPPPTALTASPGSRPPSHPGAHVPRHEATGQPSAREMTCRPSSSSSKKEASPPTKVEQGSHAPNPAGRVKTPLYNL
jgi:hypothetical protein